MVDADGGLRIQKWVEVGSWVGLGGGLKSIQRRAGGGG